MTSSGCSSFSRAQAGRGLRAVEPGMPTPAGTGLSRRAFLVRGISAGLSVYGASRLGLGALEAGVAEAAAGPAQPVLVNVFLPGGVDSLSVLAPVEDPKYAALRPTLALPATAGPRVAGDPRLMWHPAARGLHELHLEGKVAIAPAIGSADPDGSHFTSRHFWEVGATQASEDRGWMGRYLDLHGSPDNPLQGLTLESALSPSLAASSVPVAAVSRPDDFGMWAPGVHSPVVDPLLRAIGELGRLPSDDPAQRVTRAVATQVDGLRRVLAPFQDDGAASAGAVAYPAGPYGERLASLASMLQAGLPLRCVTLDAPGGYDTHRDQVQSFGRNLGAAVDGILAFQRDLEARGVADRVIVHVWSEFGRRAQENGGGTDHGAGGCAFVVGTRAKGGLLSEFPGLSTLDPNGNLRATLDFRGLYASLLEQWFGVDAAPIIPGASGFSRPSVVA